MMMIVMMMIVMMMIVMMMIIIMKSDSDDNPVCAAITVLGM